MAYASRLCGWCENEDNVECYCAPNSVCEKYKPRENENESIENSNKHTN